MSHAPSPNCGSGWVRSVLRRWDHSRRRRGRVQKNNPLRRMVVIRHNILITISMVLEIILFLLFLFSISVKRKRFSYKYQCSMTQQAGKNVSLKYSFVMFYIKICCFGHPRLSQISQFSLHCRSPEKCSYLPTRRETLY